MGLFDMFKAKGTPPSEPSNAAPLGVALVEIARLISGGDAAVLQETAACAQDPNGWFEAHQERYEERSVDSPHDLDLVQWLGLVDILEEHGWVCERDWKDELEDFSYFLQNLKGFHTLGLELDEDWFDADGDIPAWCAALAEKWGSNGARVAAIGIDSDSYVLFPVSTEQMCKLQTLAEEIGHCIDYVE